VRCISQIAIAPTQWIQVSPEAQTAIKWIRNLYGSNPEAVVKGAKMLMRIHLATMAPLPPEQQVLHAFAMKRNSVLLSKTAAPNQSLQWMCSVGHKFQLKYEDARDEGLWCNQCPLTNSAGETRCRRILESLLDAPFPTVRPAFLIRESTGQPLELDGYNEELKLAFEYQGVQHYQFSQKWHGTLEAFQDQCDRDADKAAMCQQYGIALLVIPYHATRLGAHIRSRLTEMGYINQQLAIAPVE
jgi:hypothetical protein